MYKIVVYRIFKNKINLFVYKNKSTLKSLEFDNNQARKSLESKH